MTIQGFALNDGLSSPSLSKGALAGKRCGRMAVVWAGMENMMER